MGPHDGPPELQIKQLRMQVDTLRGDLQRYRVWVDDLQAGMYVNCVYCGHRYGPGSKPLAATQQQVLHEHIAQCPEHPLSDALERINSMAWDVRPNAEEAGMPKVWTCVIGPVPASVPPGGTIPLRVAVEAAFEEMLGTPAEACFDGWASSFTLRELQVIREGNERTGKTVPDWCVD